MEVAQVCMIAELGDWYGDMSMVKRVAWALANSQGAEWDDWLDDAYVHGVHSCKTMARAAILAMRQPTEPMVLTGRTCEPFLTDHGTKWTPGLIIANECYRAMISAALAETEKADG